MNTQHHVSPDGRLQLVVVRKGTDIAIGFEGTPSHTHGDALVGEYAFAGIALIDAEAAAMQYVNDILSDNIKLHVFWMSGAIRDITALPYEVIDLAKYLSPGETIETRVWSRSGS